MYYKIIRNYFPNIYLLNTHSGALKLSCALLLVFILFLPNVLAQSRILDSVQHHLRSGIEPEWEEFSNSTPKKELTIYFNVTSKNEHTISLRQYDVKQDWGVFLNDQKIGSLEIDGNAMRIYYRLLPEFIRIGENKLALQPATTIADDIVISEITLHELPREMLLSESSIDIDVVDQETNKPIPARITIVDSKRTLQSTGTRKANHLAVRPGLIYTGDGKATVLIPGGEYTLYAGKGSEYSVDSVAIQVKTGQNLNQKLILRREVQTDGWVSSDTHIHTLTNSGHGDATDRERAITIAGEGIELPIITEHNKIVNFSNAAREGKVDSLFTIIMGDELTTPVGHFNVFPLPLNGTPPDHKVNDWKELSKNLLRNNETVVILNHGHDIHNGFRPFDTKSHISVAGFRPDHWMLPANAMEIVNSGALQKDAMRLVHDWFGLLNHGFSLTPIGASDSHDVGRYLLGQARTYVRSGATSPGKIDTKEVLMNFKQGKVMVSFGLLAKVTVNKNSGPGDTILFAKTIVVDAEVAGPGWINAERVILYANGIKIREAEIKNGNAAGVKWKGVWELPQLKQDVFLVLITEGSGDHQPFWPIVKPYQPVSKSWKPYTLGISGATWIDADRDGKITHAKEYAKQLVNRFDKDLPGLFESLSKYDEAVAVQVASLLHESGIDLAGEAIKAVLSKAITPVAEGFRKFVDGLKNTN